MGQQKNKKEEKQWVQLSTFLQSRIENENTVDIIRRSREKAALFLYKFADCSSSQRELLQSTILPRVAAYSVLKEQNLNADDIMEQYLCEVVGPAMHRKYAKAEHVPFFFKIFSKAFRSMTQKSDAWESESSAQKDSFCVTIHKCLWNDACRVCGCEQACRYFCKCDNFSFGNLKKVEFLRTQTLGTGGEMCDFKFIKK